MTNCLSGLLAMVGEDVSVAQELNTEAIFDRVAFDGGLDAKRITYTHIDALLHSGGTVLSEDLDVVFDAFSELLAYYMANAMEMTAEQAVVAVFSICAMADIARLGGGDWSMETAKTVAMTAILLDKLSSNTYMELMRYVYGKGGQSPCQDLQ